MLALKNINKKYNNKTVLNNISLNINQNQIFAVIGQNGSGKSTLLKILANKLKFDSGLINDPNNLRKKALYIDENPNVYPELTVIEQMLLIAKINKNTKERALHIAEQFFLTEVLNKRAKNLSTGFKQRLTFCLAILSNPSLLILDEPCNALDFLQKQKFYENLLNLKKETTIVISTHMLNFIDKIADSILILINGEAVFLNSNAISDNSIIGKYKEVNNLSI